MYIGDYLARRELYSPDKLAFIDAGKSPEWRLTFRDANRRANKLANWLKSQGVEKGDRVAILARDGYEHLDLFFACPTIGAIHTALNWRSQYIGVRPSDSYRFIIFTCPVRGYYNEPVRVKVETHYSRAFPGGTGEAKCGGNYAGALYPAKLGMDAGFHQLLWTDGLTHKYFEESGTMNVFFNVDGTLITPGLDGTILHGITRDSIIRIARDEGIRVEERQVSVEEIEVAARNGRLRSAFGAGTAATIAHIQSIAFDDAVYELPDVPTRELANRIERGARDACGKVSHGP